VATLLATPSIIQAAGNPSKKIEEFVGRVNSGSTEVSIARMISPQGWSEPGQRPEFDEYTVVLAGALTVQTRDGVLRVNAGQAVIVKKGEWVRYATPDAGGAEYIAVCVPAFTPETVHREAMQVS
jgi:mannose-6-phosphate isomerase-like protein (cupin superfamily)